MKTDQPQPRTGRAGRDSIRGSLRLLALLVLCGGVLTISLPGHEAAGQGGTLAVAVDADPTGNAATSLANRDACRETAQGQFQLDVVVDRLPSNAELGGIQLVLRFNSSIVRFDSGDWNFLLKSNGGSLFPENGDARLLGTDPGNPALEVWGMGALGIQSTSPISDVAGVAVRLTFTALASGSSGIEVLPVSPTEPPIQTKLINTDNSVSPIDAFVPAVVAVAPTSCPEVTPPPAPTPLPPDLLEGPVLDPEQAVDPTTPPTSPQPSNGSPGPAESAAASPGTSASSTPTQSSGGDANGGGGSDTGLIAAIVAGIAAAAIGLGAAAWFIRRRLQA